MRLLSAPFVLAALVLAPALLAALPGAEAMHARRTRIIIGVEDLDDAPGVGATFLGARVVAENDRARFVVADAPDLASFLRLAAGDARIRYVDVDREALKASGTPNDPRYGEQYGLRSIRAPEAWDTTLGSDEVVVAVIDSGIDAAHADLGRIREGRDFSGAGSISDSCGHGTHVAGIVGATTGNGVGVAGVAQASILPVKALRSTSRGCIGSFSAVANGVTWAADQGARVITMSLGCDGCTSQAVTDAVRYATGKGALVVVAAGNGGCTNCVDFPATLEEVVAVSCVTETSAICSFSSTGSEVDVAAPGDDILSTWPGNRYRLQSGTSMSTPHVAGVAALAFAANPALTASEVREAIESTARDHGPAGRDASYGRGVLDAAAALAAIPISGNRPPVASFTTQPNGLFVIVDASASSDPDGSIASWSWDWGDGSPAGSGREATHTYATAGTYRITLTVQDDDSARDTDTADVRMLPPGPLLDESFDDGEAQGWTLSGLWRVGGDCMGAKSPTKSLQYNGASTCTYATGSRTAGGAMFTLDLTAKESPQLTFVHRHEVESGTSAYDVMRVLVSTNGGSTWRLALQRDARDASTADWQPVTVDLTPYKTTATVIRFSFDTLDRYDNAHAGWAIDDVRVG